jgi:hypothetical protein
MLEIYFDIAYKTSAIAVEMVAVENGQNYMIEMPRVSANRS